MCRGPEEDRLGFEPETVLEKKKKETVLELPRGCQKQRVECFHASNCQGSSAWQSSMEHSQKHSLERIYSISLKVAFMRLTLPDSVSFQVLALQQRSMRPAHLQSSELNTPLSLTESRPYRHYTKTMNPFHRFLLQELSTLVSHSHIIDRKLRAHVVKAPHGQCRKSVFC